MAKSSSHNTVISLLITVIVFLVAVFYVLFLPETPTTSTSGKETNIPLGNAPVTKPAEIQGTTQQSGQNINPQLAAPLRPDQLNSLSL